MALGNDGIITFKEAEVDVVTTKNTNDNQQGRIMLKPGSGHFVNYSQPLNAADLDKFYEVFTNTFKYNI